MATTLHCDLAIVGGGLAGGLIALALAEARPSLDVRLIEGGDCVGGNHLWSFFASDVGPADQALVDPLIGQRWPRTAAAFPAYARAVDGGYRSIDSRRLDARCRTVLGDRLMLGRPALAVEPTAVVLSDDTQIAARGVIDARGTGDLSLLDLGWQTFLGRELDLAAPHDAPVPTIMDATVAQHDGYRFVYTLPLAPTRMFVEDTYYTDTRTLDAETARARIAAYAADHGWRVTGVAREEAGALPVALGGDFDGYWRSGGQDVAKAGMRAGLFHPTTGYSLPDAVRTASLLARQHDYSGAALHDLTHRLAADAWKRRGFYRALGRMLFRAAEPAERYRVLQRFYRLDSRLIGRFYAGQSTMTDRLRILSGKPPVPVGRAMRAMLGQRR